MRKRLTRQGYRARRTTRINQVNRRVADLNIGANDAENLKETLTKNVHTKAGLAKSKKLEKIIFSGDDKEMRKLFRFKEFSLSEGSVKPRKMKLGNVVGRMRYGYWNDSESAFMKENRDLVNDFNDLSPEEQQNKNNGIVNLFLII